MTSSNKRGDASISTSGRSRRIRWPWSKRRKKQQQQLQQSNETSSLRKINGSSASSPSNFNLSRPPAGISSPGVSYAAAMAAAYDHEDEFRESRASSPTSYSPPPPLLAQQSYGRSYPSLQHGPNSSRKNGGSRHDRDNSNTKTATTATSTTTATATATKQKDYLPGTSWLCRTERFQKICDDAFTAIDTDESGGVDEKELYSGLLLIHLKLGMYLGPAACKPLERQRCSTVFHKMDIDNSGYLDRDEFRHVMMVLFGNVFLRVMVQWSMTITIVPLVAQKLTQWLLVALDFVYTVVITLDERSFIANWVELAVEALWNALVLRFVSPPIMLVLSELGDRIESIPPAVWKTFPVTFISIVLGIVVVPSIIFKIDDFFQWLVDRKAPAKTTTSARQR